MDYNSHITQIQKNKKKKKWLYEHDLNMTDDIVQKKKSSVYGFIVIKVENE